MPTNRLHLRLLLAVAAIAIAATLTLSTLGLLIFTLGLVGWGWVGSHSGAYVRTVAVSVLSLAFPLVLIHGFLNPAFQTDGQFSWASLALSPTGLQHAATVTLRITTLLAAGFLWQQLRPGELTDDALSLGVPLQVNLLVVHAIALAREVPRRAQRVLTAQQARGMRVSGSWGNRVRAMPAVLVPVIAGVLVDSAYRAQLLHSRGFGATVVVPPPGRRWQRYDTWSLVGLGGLFILLLFLPPGRFHS